jgi:SepF-like predicted cell division protein (DUF552 family)
VTLKLRIPSKQPSEELLSLIKEVGKLGTKLADIFEQIKNKAHEEGFRDEEIKELLKNQLRGILTRNQIYWYLFEKDKYNLKKQLLCTKQIDSKKEIEQFELKPVPRIHNVQIKTEDENVVVGNAHQIEPQDQDHDNIIQSLGDLKATFESQQQYINTLEDALEEKAQIHRAQSHLRIRISISQLYYDILMVRNSNTTYTDILIDNNKYVRLEPV